MTSLWQLADAITCHTWNKDRTKVALCPNNNEIWLYSNCLDPDVSRWRREAVLSEHDMIVTGLDWSPVNDMIVSCSHDRSAFVWKQDFSRKWKPLMVVLRIARAAITVKWSPNGKKFAVSSGAKCVAVCYYQEADNWWVSKHIKKHKSTVTDVAWHPNSQLLVTGSTDLKCRVFSAYISEVDAKADSGPFDVMGPFGEVLAEFDHAEAWVNAVSWSPNGDRIAFSGHGSSVHFVHFGQVGQLPTIQSIRHRHLPMTRIAFISNDILIGAGFDFNILLFTANSHAFWKFNELLDRKGKMKEAITDSNGFNAGAILFVSDGAAIDMSVARSMWASKVTRGQNSQATTNDKDMLWTRHESCITDIRAYSIADKKDITAFSTSALDGRIALWDLQDIGIDMSNLRM